MLTFSVISGSSGLSVTCQSADLDYGGGGTATANRLVSTEIPLSFDDSF